jgi:4-amino-4-deoxy-L-arabinose transferase-like glycosyltransferase
VSVRHFPRWLFGLTLLALAVRVAYALAVGEQLGGDSGFYRGVARELVDGDGYINPLTAAIGRPHATALHPPLFPIYLAGWMKLGVTSIQGQQIACCLLGAAAVALIGLLGRRVGGPRVGLIAAGIAAVYPPLFMVDRTVNSESLYALLIVLSLVLAYRFVDRPNASRAAAVGVVIGLATLTRSEALLLLILLAAPLVWLAGQRRPQAFAACAIATALVVAPWLARNWITFDRFPLLSTNSASTLMGTNCDRTYYSDAIGFVDYRCIYRSTCSRVHFGEEGPLWDCFQRQGRSYIRNHLRRVPRVMLARVERVWEVYDPEANLEFGARFWSRPRAMATVGLIFYVLLVPFALAGAFLRRRSPVELLPLLATVLMATIVAAASFGFTRYRLVAEPALVVLAAVALERLAQAQATAIRGRLRDGPHGNLGTA